MEVLMEFQKSNKSIKVNSAELLTCWLYILNVIEDGYSKKNESYANIIRFLEYHCLSLPWL